MAASQSQDPAASAPAHQTTIDPVHDVAFKTWLDGQDQEPFRSGVTFSGLGCYGFISSSTFQTTFTSSALALPKYVLGWLRPVPKQRVQILQDLQGCIRPGEMLLVLGRPGSGCSTFLKTLAGDDHGFNIEDEDKIRYGHSSYAQMRPLKSARIYLAELDVHFPELTVQHTLSFAAGARSTASPHLADAATSLFALDEARNTQIGDAMIRGVSGGEKRRTSLAEAFLSGAPLQCWDNSTRGLDSSTALRFVRLLRGATDARGSAVAMSMYQASEAMYETFDNVMVLYEGRQIYFGPVHAAAEYFVRLGFVRPIEATTPDFLTSLTNPSERVVRPGCEKTTPRTPDEFALAWKQSPEATILHKEMRDDVPIQSPPSTAGEKSVDVKEMLLSNRLAPATVPFHSQVRLCIARGFRRLRQHYVPDVSGIISNAILSVVIGSLYFNLDETTSSFDSRAVLLFFALLHTAMTSAFDIDLMWAARPIVEKHDRYAFYRPVAEMLASLLCSLPLRLVESILFQIPLYFMTNLRRTPGAFFTYWLFMFATVLTMAMLFRMVGTLSRRFEQILVPFSTVVLFSIIYAGFVVPPGYMVPWLGWIRWINPIAYTYESLMINEFDGRRFACTNVVPTGPAYAQPGMLGKVCASIGAVAGEDFVQGSAYLQLKYGYVAAHQWRNLGIILGMGAIFTAVHLLSAEFIKAQRTRGEVLLWRRGHVQAKLSGRDQESSLPKTFPTDVGESMLSDKANGTDTAAQMGPMRSAVFHWRNLNYDIKTSDGNRRILNDINGWVKPGTLTALMGVTGAGKTSLLDVLADRVADGAVIGAVYVNGQPRDTSFRRRIGYAQQEDIHLPTATVREALEFSALMRQAGRSKAEKLAYVDTVLDMLDMGSYADAVIGVPGEGLNVEQRRRLTIAVEMAARPELLLFLDEPTSGLDSQTAWSICMLLRKMANNGQAILCTLHQPSAQLFQIFDRLLLLGKGGEQLYFGDIGMSGSAVVDYFQSNGAPPFVAGQNPAEWLVELTRSDLDAETATESRWAAAWNASAYKEQVIYYLEELELPSEGVVTVPTGSEYAASYLSQFMLVLHRNLQDYWRDPVALYSKLGLCISIALASGLSFTNSPHDIQGFTDLAFSMFLVLILFTMLDQQIIPRFTAQRDHFEARERRNRSYSWTVFLAANIVAELLWQSLASVFVFVSWYYPTGAWRNGDPSFGTSERAGLTFVLIWLFCLIISTGSQAVAVGIPLKQTAIQIAALLYWFMTLFCGVLVFPSAIPRFWVFVHRAVPFTYLIQGLLASGLANTRITCSTIEQLRIDVPPSLAGTSCGDYLGSYTGYAGGYVVNPAATEQCLYCPLDDVNTYFSSVGIDLDLRWRSVGLLVVYVVFNILATYGIYWLARVPKGRK